MDYDQLIRTWNYSHDSGGGSDPGFCKPYTEFVAAFIRDHDIKTVVDLGCGDFEVGHSIDYGDAEVTAIDASLHHINSHTEKHRGNDKFTFIHGDLESFDSSHFDLALVKDVVQHWPLENVVDFLASRHAKYLLITNDKSGGVVNGDIAWREIENNRLQVNVRGLDLNAEPFTHIKAERVLEWGHGKVTYLITAG